MSSVVGGALGGLGAMFLAPMSGPAGIFAGYEVGTKLFGGQGLTETYLLGDPKGKSKESADVMSRAMALQEASAADTQKKAKAASEKIAADQAQKDKEDKEAATLLAKRRKATDPYATSPKGLLGEAPVKLKTLLGE